MYIAKFLCLVALVVLVNGGPLSGHGRTNSKCATKCSEPSNFFYKNGKTYLYRVNTKTRLSMDKDFTEINLSGTAKIHAMGACDFALKLTDIAISGISESREYVEKLTKNDLMFSFDDGSIANICPIDTEEPWILNIKKGILSAMQTSTKVLGPKKMVREQDIMGDCETEYSIISQSYYEGTKLSKSKDLDSCRNRFIANNMFFVPHEIVEGIIGIQQSWMTGSYQCTQIIGQEGIMRKSECTEKAEWTRVWSARKFEREVKIDVTYQKTESGNLFTMPTQFKRDNLLYIKDDTPSMSPEKMKTMVLALCDSIKDRIGAETYESFEPLRRALKYSSYEHIKMMVEETKQMKMCNRDHLIGLMESALIMSGGDGASRYIIEKIEDIPPSDMTKMWSLLTLPFMDMSEKTVETLLPILQKTRSPRLSLWLSAAIGNVVQRGDKISTWAAIDEAVNVMANYIPPNCGGDSNEIVSYIKSIGNIGRSTPGAQRKLMVCLRTASASIQAATLDAIRQSKMCKLPGSEGSQVKSTLEELMLNSYTMDSDEVPIAAFKAYMECGEGREKEQILDKVLEIMRNNRNERLGAYVQKYLLNIKSSKTVAKSGLREMLASRKIDDWMAPVNPMAKLSDHTEYSYFSEELNMGFDLEMDTIMSRGSSYPRTLMVRLDIPVMDKTVELIEVGIRQEGMDRELERIWGENGPFTKEKWMDLVKQIRDLQSLKKGSEKWYQLLNSLKNAIASAKYLSMYIMYNGKTLLYMGGDENSGRWKRDLGSWSSSFDTRKIHTNLIEPLIKSELFGKRSKMLALSFLDSCMKIPTITGLPIRYKAGGSIVMSTKMLDDSTGGKAISVWPNFAMGYSMAWSILLAGDKEVGLKWDGTAMSDITVKAKLSVEGNYPKELEIQWPEREMSIIKLKSGSYIFDGTNRRPKAISSLPTPECSKTVFGMAVCSRESSQQPWGMFLDRNVASEIMLKKFEAEMKSWKMVFTYPKRSNDEFRYEWMFETPGSRSENRIEWKLNREMMSDKRTMYKFMLKYQKAKQIDGNLTFNLKNRPIIQLLVNAPDGKHMYELSGSQNGPLGDGELSGKLRIENPTMKSPIELDGTMEVKLKANYNIKGEMYLSNTKRSTRIRIAKADLKTEGVWLFGGWTRTPNSLYKAVFNMQTGNPKYKRWFNVGLTLQRNSFISLDGVFDYKTIQMTKAQKMEVHGKFYDKGVGQMTQIQTMGEITSTQWPQINGHFTQKFIYKPQEHVENELLMRWKGRMDDKKQKVHILQISKALPGGENAMLYENQLRMFIGPKDINYDIMYKWKSRRSSPKGSLAQMNHELELKNVDVPKNTYRGVMNYEMASRSPFRAVYGISWKTPAGERSFSEEIKEIKPNQYAGKITVKSNVAGEKKYGYEIDTLATSNRSAYSTDITVRKIEGNQNIGNFKLEVNGENSNQVVNSRLTYRGREMFDLNFSRMEGKSLKAFLKAKSYGHIDFTMQNTNNGVSKCKFQLRCDLHDMDHETTMNIISDSKSKNYGYTLGSDTLMSRKSMLKASLSQLWDQNLKASLTADRINAEIVLDKLSADGRSIKLTYKDKEMTHTTSFLLDRTTGKISFKSGTKRGNVPLGRIEFTMQEFNSQAEANLTAYLNAFSGMDVELNLKEKKRGERGVMGSLRLRRMMSTSSPVVYEIKGQLTETVKSLMVMKKMTAGTMWGIETYMDETQFLFDLRNPYLMGKLTIGGEHSPNLLKITVAGKDQWFLHETTLASLASKNTNFLSRTTVDGKDVLYINWSLTPKLNSIEGDTQWLNAKLTIGDDYAMMEFTTKGDNKRRYMSLKKSSLDPAQITLELDIMFDANHNPNDRYLAKATVPTTVGKRIEVNFEAREPSFCETKLAYKKDDTAEESFKLNFDRRCPRNHKIFTALQKKMGKNYHHFVEYKENGISIIGIDCKSKLSREDVLRSLKLQVKSSNKDIDGAYLDLKTETDQSALIVVKPPYLDKLITLNLRLQPGKSLFSFILTADGLIETIGTTEKRKFKEYFRLDDVGETSFQYQYEINGRISPIMSKRIVLGNNISITFDYVPSNTKLDLFHQWNTIPSTSFQKLESKLLIVHQAKELAKLASVARTPSEFIKLNLITIKGQLLGYPMVFHYDSACCKPEQMKVFVKQRLPDGSLKHPSSQEINLEPDEKDLFMLRVDQDGPSRRNSVRALLRVTDLPICKMEYESEEKSGAWMKKFIYKQNDNRYGFMANVRDKDARCELFLKERIVKLERSEKINEATTTLWLDAQRKPDDKLNLIQKYQADSAESAIRTIVVQHPAFKKPITLKIETKPIESGFILKSELDYSRNAGHNIFFEINFSFGQKKSDQKFYVKTFKLYRGDRKVDFTWDERVNMAEIFTENSARELSIDSMINNKWKSATGAIKSILREEILKVAYSAYTKKPTRIQYRSIVKPLSGYFLMDADVDLTKGPEIGKLDMSFQENGPIYRLASTLKKLTDRKCVALELFKVGGTQAEKATGEVCLSNRLDSKEPLMNLSIKRQTDSANLAEMKVVKNWDSQNTYRVTVLWNPEHVGTIAVDSMHGFDKLYSESLTQSRELREEWISQVKLIYLPIREEVIQPMVEYMDTEMSSAWNEIPNVGYQDWKPRRIFKRSASGNQIASIEKLGNLTQYPLRTLLWALNFKLISNNADNGEIIFDIGNRYIL